MPIDFLHTALGFAVAVCLWGCGLWSSYAIASCLLPRVDTLTRLAATMAAALWICQVAFHALASLSWFNVPAALVGATALVAVLQRMTRGNGLTVQAARHDREVLARLLQRRRRAGWPPMLVLVALVAALVVCRAIIMPVLGWDTMVYHAVKPALWVQTGGYEPWRPPGGWSIFLLHPGASEVLIAWAMLPFHGDLAAGIDGFVWLGLGLATVVLGRRLGVREPYASTAAAFVLSVPTARLMVGSGCAELAVSLSVMLALVFTVRYFQKGLAADLVLACAMLGTLAGTKVTMAVPAGLIGLQLLAKAATLPRRRALGQVAIGIGAAALVHGPWLLRNVLLSGYPLSPVPLRIAGVTLGRSNEAVESLGRYVTGLPAWDWAREARVVKALFVLPGSYDVGFGALTAIPIALAIPALVVLARRQWRSALLLALVCLAFLAVYFTRQLLHIRMFWTTNSARFILPVVCIALPLSVTWCRSRPWLGRVYLHVLWGASAFYLVWYAVAGWNAYDAQGVLGALALAAGGLALVRAARKPRARAAVALASALVVALSVNAYKKLYRYESVRDGKVFDGTRTYWWSAARKLDDRTTTHNIAMTSGPQNGGDWFAYYFMGTRFQNRIGYVSAAESGRPAQFRYDSTDGEATFPGWVDRLKSGRFTHVMGFHPAALELRWMEQHPELFSLVEGERGRWGLFAVRP